MSIFHSLPSAFGDLTSLTEALCCWATTTRGYLIDSAFLDTRPLRGHSRLASICYRSYCNLIPLTADADYADADSSIIPLTTDADYADADSSQRLLLASFFPCPCLHRFYWISLQYLNVVVVDSAGRINLALNDIPTLLCAGQNILLVWKLSWFSIRLRWSTQFHKGR